MDKRKIQRILGFLVIIAIALILLPLVFTKNEAPTQTTSIITPTFPEEPRNTVAATSPPQEEKITPPPSTPPAVFSQAATPETLVKTPSTAINPSDFSPAAPAELTKAPAALLEKPMIKAHQQVIPEPKHKLINIPNQFSKAHADTKLSTISASPHINVAQFNKPAWVLQLGSFTKKENARNLTNKLRAAGFNAFTKEIKSAEGHISTRVYVGPEFKQANVTKISQQIQRKMNLSSVIVSYKPFAL